MRFQRISNDGYRRVNQLQKSPKKVLNKMKNLKKRQCFFLIEPFGLFLGILGKVNFLDMVNVVNSSIEINLKTGLIL